MIYNDINNDIIIYNDINNDMSYHIYKTRAGLLCLAVQWGPEHGACRAQSFQCQGLSISPAPDLCPKSQVLTANSENMLSGTPTLLAQVS